MKHMVIMAILHCSPHASLATSKTLKCYFHIVPCQDVFKNHQDDSRRIQEGSRRLLYGSKRGTNVQHSSKTVQEEVNVLYNGAKVERSFVQSTVCFVA